MSEVEVVYRSGPLVLGEPLMDLPEIEGEWAEGNSQVLAGAFRMARAAEHARIKGDGAFRHLMALSACEKSWLYKLAEAWRTYGQSVLDGEFSGRLESLSISHLITALKAPEPMKALEMAEEEGLSVRQLTARIEGDDTPQNVETIELCSCPKCGEVYPMSEALVWSEPRPEERG